MTPIPPADRVPVPDPDSIRRGARRSVRASIIVVALLTGFTASGTAMLLRGEHHGIPFAVGGAISQLASIAITAAALRVSNSLHGTTVARTALTTAGRISTATRTATLATLAALAAYAIIRLAAGDPWPLLTTAIIGVPLALFLRGSDRLQKHSRTMAANPDQPGR